MEMRQAHDDILAQRACEKSAQRDGDDEKDLIGEALVVSASKRKKDESQSSSDDDETGSAPKTLKAKCSRVDSSMDMAAFSLKLKAREV